MGTNKTWFSWHTTVAGNSISFILYFNSSEDVIEVIARAASSLNTYIASTFDCLASLLAIVVGLGGGGGLVRCGGMPGQTLGTASSFNRRYTNAFPFLLILRVC